MDRLLKRDQIRSNRQTCCLLLMLALGFLLSSCINEVEIEPLLYVRKVVVDGQIESGRSAQVYLTLSSPFLEDYDSASIINSFLNDAKVTLRSSLGEEEDLVLAINNNFFPPYVYRSVQITGRVGVEYSLEIDVAGRKVYASTSIPYPPLILGTRFTYQTDTTGYIEYRVSELSNNVQYLYTRVRSSFANENLHPSKDGSIRVGTGDGLGWLKVYRVRDRRIGFEPGSEDFYENYPGKLYDYRDEITLVPGCVDSVSHEIINSLFDDWGSNDNPFRFNDAGIKTNIEGGIGLWIGIGTHAPIIIRGN